MDFFMLARTLFAHKSDDEQAKKINELLSKDSKFYKTAVEIAKDCKMDWDNLSPEDSDELQLILLDEYYNNIRVDENMKINLRINIGK